MLSRWLPTDSISRLPFGPTHQVGVGIFVTLPLSMNNNNNNHHHPHQDMTNNTMMLVVRERTGPAAARQLWKMPTGLLDPGEELGPAAVRELREETGLEGVFEGVICFRHATTHGGSGRSISDLFFVCQVKLIVADNSATINNNTNAHDDDDDENDNDNIDNNNNINHMFQFNKTQLQNDEIADIRWMPVQEYAAQETWQASPVYRELNQVLLERAMMVPSNNRQPSWLLQAYSLPLGFAPGTNTVYKPRNLSSSSVNNEEVTGNSKLYVPRNSKIMAPSTGAR
jgi:ADP-ribose pyrophosphatase YjhB (NUDIX family)